MKIICKILLVGHDPDIINMIRSVLAVSRRETDQYDFHLITTEYLHQVPEVLKADKFDIILIPFLDSSSLVETSIRYLRLEYPFLKVIAYGDRDGLDAALDVGVWDYLIKDQINEFLVKRIIRNAMECRRAEEELEESEDKFRDVFDQSIIGKVITQATGEMQINRAFAEMLGYSIDELKGKNFLEITHPEDVDASRRMMELLLSGGANSVQFTKRYLHKSGKTVWSEVRLHLRRNKEGKPLYFISTIIDITDRLQMENALRESERFVHSTLNALSSHIAVLDETGTIIYINRAWSEFASANDGDPQKTGVGINYLSVCDQAEANDTVAHEMAAGIRSVMKGEDSRFTIEYSCHSPSEPRWFMAHVTRFEETGPLRIVVQHENITGRKLAEENIVRQIGHLKALRKIDEAIEGGIDLHSVLEIFLKHSMAELEVDAAVILLYDPDEQRLKYELGAGLQTNALRYTRLKLGDGYAGRAMQNRKVIFVPNLQTRMTDFLRSPTFSLEGFICYVGIPLIAKDEVKGVLEIFHRTAMEPNQDWFDFAETLAGRAAIAIDNAQLFDGLQRSNTELRMAYDTTIEGWSKALDLRDKETEGHTQRVTELTVQMARAMGFGEEEIEHIRRGALLHDIGKMGVPDNILLKNGALNEEEWKIMRMHPVYAHELLFPIRFLQPALDIPYCHHEKWDGSGYPRGLRGEQIPLAARLFAVVDIWDAVRSGRPYRKAWSKKKALEHIKSLSGSHLDPKVVELFLGLINDIFNLSKTEAGKLDLNLDTFFADDLCRSSLSFVKELANKKSITLEFHSDPPKLALIADPRRLKQILVNLLSNAVKFTPANGLVQLEVEADTQQGLIRFSVVDNGVGISSDNLQRLFKPFVQVDSSLNRQHEGTGLGLVLVQRLTDLHGGSVHVESKIGVGSRFTVNLPWTKDSIAQQMITRDDSRNTELEQKAIPWNVVGEPEQRGTILLAEDNMANVLTIGDYLEGHGYKIVAVHNGVEAIDKTKEINPDIILMDIQMPIMNGLEAIRRLRADSRFESIPIIALTALAMSGDRERCLQAGATEYLSKPVVLKQLVKTIRTLME